MISKNNQVNQILMNILRVGVAVWAWASLFAVAAEPPDPCVTQANTIEINACMKQQYDVSDRELNQAYKALLKRIQDHDPQFTDRGAVRRRLVEAQRHWIEFRKNDCEGQYKLFESGTIRNARMLGCLIEHTAVRTKQFKDWDQP